MNRTLITLIIIFTLSAFVMLPLTMHASETPDLVRIGLTHYGSGVKQITVSASAGPVSLSSEKTTTSYQGSITLDIGTAGFICRTNGSTTDLASLVTISPEDPTAFLVVGCPGRSDRQYRGTIELTVKSGFITLVNILPVDDYLKGVLPSEIGSGAPEEALKAQAIVARNYTLTNKKKHSTLGYGLCDSTCCQVYSGVSVESERCNNAIADTSGQVLMYGGQLAEVFYSTDSGGVTQSYEEAYKKSSYPYLGAVSDPCTLNHHSWERSFKLPEIESKLTMAGVKQADGLRSIKASMLGASGRVQEVEIVGKLGAITISSSKLRAALGYDVIKSTLFTFESSDDGSLVIKGKGWGHGIGLCQTGAIQLAKAPHEYNCDRILAHYFPGTHISRLNADSNKALLTTAAPSIAASGTGPAIRTEKNTPVASAAKVQSPTKEYKPTVLFQVRVKAPDSL